MVSTFEGGEILQCRIYDSYEMAMEVYGEEIDEIKRERDNIDTDLDVPEVAIVVSKIENETGGNRMQNINLIEVIDEVKELIHERIELGNNDVKTLKHATLSGKSEVYKDLNLIKIGMLQIFFNNEGDIISVDYLERVMGKKESVHISRHTLFSNDKLTEEIRDFANSLPKSYI